jgi:hypothetical protein
MNINEALASVDGNWMAAAYERSHVKRKCHTCNGTGRVPADLDKVKEIVYCTAFGRTWKQIIRIYRDWKKNDETIECEDCGGAGEGYRHV